MLLESNKLYYLSHPFTTYGSREENIQSASHIECLLMYEHGATCLNPVVLPLGTESDECMAKCRKLYDICDVVLLSPGWQHSEGCRQEYMWAIEDGKPMFEVEVFRHFFKDKLEFKIVDRTLRFKIK